MHKLIEQFEAADAPKSDEGVVAVEYILITVAAVAALGAAFALFYGNVSTELGKVFPAS
jgi:hypothetical protein